MWVWNSTQDINNKISVAIKFKTLFCNLDAPTLNQISATSANAIPESAKKKKEAC